MPGLHSLIASTSPVYSYSHDSFSDLSQKKQQTVSLASLPFKIDTINSIYGGRFEESPETARPVTFSNPFSPHDYIHSPQPIRPKQTSFDKPLPLPPQHQTPDSDDDGSLPDLVSGRSSSASTTRSRASSSGSHHHLETAAASVDQFLDSMRPMTTVFPHLDEAAADVDFFLDNMRPLTAFDENISPKGMSKSMTIEPLDLTPTLDRFIHEDSRLKELQHHEEITAYMQHSDLTRQIEEDIQIYKQYAQQSELAPPIKIQLPPRGKTPELKAKPVKQDSVDSLQSTISSRLRQQSVYSDSSDLVLTPRSGSSAGTRIEMGATITDFGLQDPFSQTDAWSFQQMPERDDRSPPLLPLTAKSLISPMEHPDSPFSYAPRRVSGISDVLLSQDPRQVQRGISPPTVTIDQANPSPWKGKGKLPPIRTIDWSRIPQDNVKPFCDAYTLAHSQQIDMSLQVAPSPVVRSPTNLQPQLSKEEQGRRSTAGALAMKRQLDAIRQARKNEKPKEDPKAAQRAAEKAALQALQAAKAQKAKQQQKMLAMNERLMANEGRINGELAQLDLEGQQRRIREEERRRRREEEKMRAAQILQQQLEAEEAERARLARIKECAVCGDSKDQDEFPAKPPTSRCQHAPQICLDCLDAWVSSALSDNGVEGIKCPECPEKLSYDDVHEASSPITFEAYDKAATTNALSQLPDFNWCLAPGCNSGQLNVDNSNFMECASCKYKQCLRHSVPWHAGESCEQYDYRTSGAKAREEEEKTMAMLDTISKKCPGPGCGWRIQKTDGCDHITCRKCRHEFCWQCLASHAEIKRVGNTAHLKSCKFHSDNLDLAWPFNRH